MAPPILSMSFLAIPSGRVGDPTSPQSDFRKLKMSPNAAEGKERLGLKDLGALAAQKTSTNTPETDEKPSKSEQGNTNSPTLRPNSEQHNTKNQPAKNNRHKKFRNNR